MSCASRALLDSPGLHFWQCNVGPSVCDGATAMLPAEQAYIDDFETDARFAGWYAFADDGVAEPHSMTPEGPGAVSTQIAGHVSAIDILPPPVGYGAGFGFNMIDPAFISCVDVSSFDGVSFWAKGTSGDNEELIFQVVHPATQPIGEGGDCLANCYDHPKTTIVLTPDWTQYTVTWGELTGVAVTGPILSNNWITAGETYDVWVDELTLYKGIPPQGPVGVGAGGAGGADTAGPGGAGGSG